MYYVLLNKKAPIPKMDASETARCPYGHHYPVDQTG